DNWGSARLDGLEKYPYEFIPWSCLYRRRYIDTVVYAQVEAIRENTSSLNHTVKSHFYSNRCNSGISPFFSNTSSECFQCRLADWI
ncbi:hypothetical protein ACFLYL_04245, partial [Chloroflexota bacterium]